MKLKRVMILFIVACVFATSAHAAQMSVEPAYQKVCKGDNITVNITVYPEGSEVYGASYTLYFNNTLLNATSQTQGPFLTQDGESSTVWWDKIDNPNGTVEYSESRMGHDSGVTDPGVLATITFQVIGVEGTSSLGISDYNGELLYSTTGSILTNINNGTCEIGAIIGQTPTSPPSVPPTTTPVQTPTTIPITPTPTAAAIQTPTISSTPSSSPTIIISPISPTASTSPPKEKSEENNGMSGFRAAFAITGLLTIFILKRKNVIK